MASRELGVVPHGLRHQGAADDFQEITNCVAPVAGGPPIDRELDLQARREIANRLGHNRVQITCVYLGKRHVFSAVATSKRSTDNEAREGGAS